MTVSNATATTSTPQEANTPDRLDPAKVRVVDVEKKGTNEVLRRDCYDPDGDPVEMGDVMRVTDGELWLRTVDWARSTSHSEEPKIRWEPTGLTRKDVGRIGVYAWPVGTPVRIFGEKKPRQ